MNKRDRHYKSCFDSIKGLLYGYKLRKILRLDKMQEVKSNIHAIEAEINQAGHSQVQRLEHELLY